MDFGGFQGSEAKPLDGGQDVVCRLGPDEGFGIGVDGLDVARDRRFEFGGRAMDAATDLFFGQIGKEALDPGLRRGRL